MKLIHPINETKRLELEQELDFQKTRFLEASRHSWEIIRHDLSIQSWIYNYPLESIFLAAASGFFIGRRISRH